MTNILNLQIQNLRGIKSLTIDLNLKPGIYAITGKNATGKSTIMAAISTIFYRNTIHMYFQSSTADSIIECKCDDKVLKITRRDESHWNFDGDFDLHGFYEGSIIHGNRFRDTNYSALNNALKVTIEDLTLADPFVKEHLGIILQNDAKFYSSLYRLKSNNSRFKNKFKGGSPYFIKDGDELISQFSLSTGENLLIPLLHSIHYQLVKKAREAGFIVLLDEIELALHPQALVRLIQFLEQMSRDRGIAIYFSTHSTDLIKHIAPANIYYLQKHPNGSVEVVNPCYPCYATRNISMFDGYDLLILVEDNLAKGIVEWVQRKYNLCKSKLICIVPCGGGENTLALQSEMFHSGLLGYNKSIISILDGDIADVCNEKYIRKGKYKDLNIAFTPISSIEKFLLDKLITNIDYKFFREFGDSFFKKKPLEEVINLYLTKRNGTDSSGKFLYKFLMNQSTIVGNAEQEFIIKITEYVVSVTNVDDLAERISKALN